MEAATLIKYVLAIQRISELDVEFDPPDGRITVRYTGPGGPAAQEISFAEIVELLTTSNPSPPGASEADNS